MTRRLVASALLSLSAVGLVACGGSSGLTEAEASVCSAQADDLSNIRDLTGGDVILNTPDLTLALGDASLKAYDYLGQVEEDSVLAEPLTDIIDGSADLATVSTGGRYEVAPSRAGDLTQALDDLQDVCSP